LVMRISSGVPCDWRAEAGETVPGAGDIAD
jgi:hypothetical protein